MLNSKIEEEDIEQRFAKWFYDRLTEDADFNKKKIIFSDVFILNSAERRWLCIRLNNAEKWACDRLTEDADFVRFDRLVLFFR